MITEQEIRFGNYLNYDNIAFKVVKIAPKFIGLDNEYDFEDYADIKDIQPIPITEEILLKCGFEKLTTKSEGYNASSYSYRRGYSLIVCLDDGIWSVSFWQGNEKKYLHQLQNLFFALTNEELEITL